MWHLQSRVDGTGKTPSRRVPGVQGAERDQGPGLNWGTVGGERELCTASSGCLTVGSYPQCVSFQHLAVLTSALPSPSPLLAKGTAPVWTSREAGPQGRLLLHHPGGPLSSPQRQLRPRRRHWGHMGLPPG